MSRLNEKDTRLLYELSKHPGYEAAKRVFGENLREQIHLQMEVDIEVRDIYFHQGEINGIKSVFAGVDQAVRQLKKIEEAQKTEEVITNE